MNILMIGMGYVGTTMGIVFADAGHRVTGFDIDERKVQTLQKGELYFHEPDLDEKLRECINRNTISFTTDPEAAIKENDILFITVGTPSLDNGKADLAYVKEAVKIIGHYQQSEKIVIVKSTVPIGTTEHVRKWLKEEQEKSYDTYIGMNPEFLREGSALYDALHPDRIVIGSEDKEVIEAMEKLYESWDCPFIQTSTRGAEMIKYASNAFLAAKISYINQIARLCDALDVNVKDVSQGMGLDPRIGSAFLQAGLGYGGSCFPKDVKEFITTADDHYVSLSIVKEAEKTNMQQPAYFIEKLKKHFSSLQGKKVTVLGLAFKPHTDDTRESVAFPIIKELQKNKAVIQVHDPVVQLDCEGAMKDITPYRDPYEAVKEADAIIICTNWPQYEELDWQKVKQNVRNAFVFDGRNMLNAEQMKKLHFHYEGMGYG